MVMSSSERAEAVADRKVLLRTIAAGTSLIVEDVITTGTPASAGAELDPLHWLVVGDLIGVEVDRVEVLRNTVECCESSPTPF